MKCPYCHQEIPEEIERAIKKEKEIWQPWISHPVGDISSSPKEIERWVTTFTGTNDNYYIF